MASDIRRQAAPSMWDVMDELMNRAWHANWPTNGHSASFQVPMNAWETRDGYQFALMAPGCDTAALNVNAVGGTLTVEGEVKVETPEGATPLWREFGPAKFRRTIQLPDAINPEGVDAYYKNGLVFLTVPK